jgi:transposase, IS5 family
LGLVLVCRNPQPTTLWDQILPEPYLDLPAELAAVDALLGRPSIPIETYLRMLFLKSCYKLSYETLCREVADSISWTRFCCIPLGGRVPHPTTLRKITRRCGEQTIAGEQPDKARKRDGHNNADTHTHHHPPGDHPQPTFSGRSN